VTAITIRLVEKEREGKEEREGEEEGRRGGREESCVHYADIT